MKKVAVIGTGSVGKVLANAFADQGYEVKVGSRNPESAEAFENLELIGQKEAMDWGEIVVLAVPGSAGEKTASLSDLSGKTVIDTMNPISGGPSSSGVLPFFTERGDSLIARMQKAQPDAHFVKAFNSVGANLMYKPQMEGGRPAMFICGDSSQAKDEVVKILDSFGWGAEDFGGSEAGEHIESLCALWCIPYFQKGQRDHAFALLRSK